MLRLIQQAFGRHGCGNRSREEKIKQASVEALKRPEMKSSSVASLPIN